MCNTDSNDTKVTEGYGVVKLPRSVFNLFYPDWNKGDYSRIQLFCYFI